MADERETEDEQIEDNLGEDYDETTPFQYAITAYGADYPVDGLVQRISKGDIFIPPFQRAFVWNLKQASRFVESFLLGLPVPGIFLSKQEETQKLLVIDGQQRLRTLQYFYDGIFGNTGREFALNGVQSKFEGAVYKSLPDDDRRRLDDSILHATIVKQDQPSDDDSSIYHIFERLNTGGLSLSPQEIRACIYHGEFNELLQRLNQNEAWRSIFGGPVHIRMRDQELLLRFFALYFNAPNYSRPMKQFLNSYMGRNRHLAFESEDTLTNVFERTIKVVAEHIGSKAFRRPKTLNAAIFDSMMVGIARRLQKGGIQDPPTLQARYESLLNDPAFVDATETGTASEENVRSRLKLATNAFADVK